MHKFTPNILKDVVLISSLILIAIASHSEWFNPYSTLSFGDWPYKYSESVYEYVNGAGAWMGSANLGGVNIQMYFNIFYFVWAILVKHGIWIDFATKINVFIPIAVLGFISPYILAKKLVSDQFISFVTAVFFGSTTYFLASQTSHLPIAFVYSITPLIFFVFINALEKNKLINWINFSIIYSVGLGYELRIMYIVSFLLLFYFTYFYIDKFINYLRNGIITLLIIILLNLYWFMPTLFGGMGGDIDSIAGRGLFGGSLSDILRSFTLYHWSWTGSETNRVFSPQTIQLQFWILPIFVLITLFFKNNKYLKNIVFFLIIFLSGIFLTKQSGPPFQDAYEFLYNNFPGFVLFREASKFYLLVAFAYLGLLVYVLKFWKIKDARLFSLFSITLLVLCFFNLKPLITKEYNTLFIARKIPSEYILFKDHVLKQNEQYRTLWIPARSRWGFYSLHNPRISIVGLSGGVWNNFAEDSDELTTGERLVSILNKHFSPQLLNLSSVKFIAVPLESETDLEARIFEYYGEEREFYISELDKLEYLERVDIGTGNLVIYENKDYRPRVYITKVQETITSTLPYERLDHEITSSAEHNLDIKDVSGDFYINFSENYHPNWKLRIGEFSWFDALIREDYFISDENHIKNDANLNSFVVNVDEVCSLYQCTSNKDGTYDMHATLYFKPQSYFYAGVIISVATLISIIGYFTFIVVGSVVRKYGSTKK